MPTTSPFSPPTGFDPKLSPLDRDRALIRGFLDQPDRLPDEVRRLAEAEWDGDPVQLYALADLTAELTFTSSWILLGPRRVAVATPDPEAPQGWRIESFDRETIGEVTESRGLSANVLRIRRTDDGDTLATVRYTSRQRPAMGNLIYLLQERTALPSTAEGADETYAAAMTSEIKDAQATVAGHQMAVVWRLIGYLKPYRAKVALGIVAGLLMTLVSLAPPWLTGALIDKVLRPFEAGTLAHREAWRMSAWILAGVLGAYALRTVLAWIRMRIMAFIGEWVARDLRNDLYEHLQRLSISFFSKRQTGSIITRVSSDTDRLWDFVAFGMVEVSLSAFMVVGLGAILLWMDWRLGLLVIVPVPFLLWYIRRCGRIIHGIFLRGWRKWADLTGVLADTIPGIRVVKAFHQEDHEKARFKERNRIVVDEFNRVHGAWTNFQPIQLLLMHLVAVAVWTAAVWRMLGGMEGAAPTLTTGEFVAFLLYLGMFFMPIEVFSRMTWMLNRSVSSAHRVFEILDTEPASRIPARGIRLEPVKGRVAFENVRFTYDGVRPVLKGISFVAEPGQMIGLVGPSGSGKTTLMNLIARFYDPTDGSITIDGTPLADLDVGHYRRQLGMVMQDPFLFHGTILDNLRYGLPEATPGQIIEAARAASAHDFICRLPHAYETIVGERGHTLSGGERQRIAIARAILHDPRILLLDEATSSVDTETERSIQNALARLVQGRTTIAIAHRLSTVTRADLILVLKEGRIVETGRHDDLMAIEDGVYRNLYRMQSELHQMYAV